MAFFPTQESAAYFRTSEQLGYTYDDMASFPSDKSECGALVGFCNTSQLISTYTRNVNTTEFHQDFSIDFKSSRYAFTMMV